MTPIGIFLFFSTIILIGYFSNIIYTRTGVPDLIWLLVFGLILGPVLNLVDRGILIEISPILSVATIILITFEAGTDIDYETLKSVLPTTTVLSLFTFTLITVGTGLVTPRLFPGMGFTESLMLGTFLGGISTVAVMGAMDKLKIIFDDVTESRLILYLESTIVDPIRVMTAIALIKIMLRSEVLPREVFKEIFFVFLAGSVVGLVSGVLWMMVLHRLRNLPYNYMVTVAVLLQVYYLAEIVGGDGGGTMACFTFGFALANHRLIGRRLGFRPLINIKRLVQVNDEISFVLKSYYFVYTGIIASLSPRFLAVGTALTALIIALRFLSAELTGVFTDLGGRELRITSLVYPLGTSAFVFSQLPSIYDPGGQVIQNPDLYSNIVFPVVLGTILFTALLVPRILGHVLKNDGDESM
jgi:cell volume regulation protein A